MNDVDVVLHLNRPLTTKPYSMDNIFIYIYMCDYNLTKIEGCVKNSRITKLKNIA